MLEAGTGPKRIKGLLPDGRRLALAVFVTDAHAGQGACEHVIAAIAKAVYDAALTRQARQRLLPVDFNVSPGAAMGNGNHDSDADRDQNTDHGPSRADAGENPGFPQRGEKSDDEN